MSDWFAQGGTVEGFNALVDQAPDWIDNGTQASDETPQHNGRILRGTEFADLSTSSKKVWLVHHLLAIGEISVWYGEPGSGKSVGIEDLGLYVAVGRAWHGRQVKQCAVLYVALERANVVQRRAIAWGLEHGLSREHLPFKVIRGPLDFRDPQVAADIVATLEDLARRHGCEAGLIIVDTVSRALCGGDENSPKDMGALIANIGRIQSAIGVHIALTHHQPVDGKERMRGHGALLGAVDTTIHVVNKDGTRLAEVVKSSDHEEGQRIAFFLKSVIIDQDDGYGDPVTAPVVVEDQAPTTAKAAKRAVKIPKNATLALNALRDAVPTADSTSPMLTFRPACRSSPSINGATTHTAAAWAVRKPRVGRKLLPAPPSASPEAGSLAFGSPMHGPCKGEDSLETKRTGSKDPCLLCPLRGRRFVSFVAFVSLRRIAAPRRPDAGNRRRRQ